LNLIPNECSNNLVTFGASHHDLMKHWQFNPSFRDQFLLANALGNVSLRPVFLDPLSFLSYE